MSSTCCFGPFVSEATWVGSCLSGGSRLETRDISGNCCVTSPGSRVGITELFAAGSTMLRLWHGLGLFRWLVSRWESSGPASRSSLRRVGGRVARTGRERVLHTGALLLNCPVLDLPTGGWSNQSVCMGRSPAHVQGFWGQAHVI